MRPKIFSKQARIGKGTEYKDTYQSTLEELFFVRNPKFRKGSPEAKKPLAKFLKKSRIKPVWISYPKKGVVVKSLPEKEYFELRTARNRNLITADEQKKFRDAVAGIAGLSVGSSIVAALALSGGPKRMKLADPDTLEATNLNRIRAGIADIGRKKTDIIADYIWNMDPFAKLYLFHEGIVSATLEKFILGAPKLDIFIDEMDNLSLKAAARRLCRSAKIPVLMATDNGDGVILDVERYDREPKTKLFNGRVPEPALENLENVDRKKWLTIVKKIIGTKDMTKRHRHAIREIGILISGIPQLGATASLAGATVSYAVRKLVNREALPSGRYLLNLEAVF